jgi:hypothetical protein
MTVGQLIKLLKKFPPQYPVFFSPEAAGRLALSPRDAIMNLVNPDQSEVIEDDESTRGRPHGYVDGVVIYPREVGGYGTP